MSTGLDFVSTKLLEGIDFFLDANGATEWSQRSVVLVSFFVLVVVKLVVGKKHGIEWYSLVHSLLTGIGAVLCIWLDVFASRKMTGALEWHRVYACQPPLTTLHRILPAITMGYSVLDLVDGIALGLIEFVIHGIATLFISGFWIAHDMPHVVTPILVMEVSTIFLSLVRCDLLSNTGSLVNQLMFMTTFFLSRIVIGPYIGYEMNLAVFANANDPQYIACNQWYIKWVCLFFTLFYCALNSFCRFSHRGLDVLLSSRLYFAHIFASRTSGMYKIIRKARRKLSGREAIKAQNGFAETVRDQASSGKKNA